MIPERNKKQARRTDNEELVQGSLLSSKDRRTYIVTDHYPQILKGQWFIRTNLDNDECYEVHPSTVEDIAVLPDSLPGWNNSFTPICPNCKYELSSEKYCPECGQRILWKEQD